MMYFVRFSERSEIYIVGPGEPFESLVNKHVMHQEVCDSIKGNTHTDEEHKAVPFNKIPYSEEKHGNRGKHHKKVVILLEEMRRFIVMILMQIPEQAMHNVLVGEPGNAFHETESEYYNTNV